MNDLTPKQEKFSQSVASGKSQADAYRLAYNAGNMKEETVWSNASVLMADNKVSARVDEIRKPIVECAQFTLDQHLINLMSLRDKAAEDGKWGAAIAAEIGRGKAAGLYVNKGDSDDDKNLTVKIVRFGDT